MTEISAQLCTSSPSLTGIQSATKSESQLFIQRGLALLNLRHRYGCRVAEGAVTGCAVGQHPRPHGAAGCQVNNGELAGGYQSVSAFFQHRSLPVIGGVIGCLHKVALRALHTVKIAVHLTLFITGCKAEVLHLRQIAHRGCLAGKEAVHRGFVNNGLVAFGHVIHAPAQFGKGLFKILFGIVLFAGGCF